MIVAGTIVACIIGCTSAGRFIHGELTDYDEHTKYRVDDIEGGFKLSVLYEQYQFVKDRDEVAENAMQVFRKIAIEQAKERGHTIKPIDPDFMKIGTGRSGLGGTTSWSGIAKIEYKD